MAREMARGAPMSRRGTHPRSLANLEGNRQSFPPAALGNQRARTTGAWSTLGGPVAEYVEREMFDSLSEASPLRTDPKFLHLIALASTVFQRFTNQKLAIDEQKADLLSPRVQSWIETESRLRRECNGYLQQLDMAPSESADEIEFRRLLDDLRASVAAERAAAPAVRVELVSPVVDVEPEEVSDGEDHAC
jgi:hypothetical protein